MTDKQHVKILLDILDQHYPKDIPSFLNHENPLQLLIATILSAQCTDDRVNIVTQTLFKKYPTVEAFANAELEELQVDIKSTGFYKNKAKNIISCTKTLIEKYNGEVPREIEELITLAGVGRKTANVVRGNIFDIPSIVVDTHVKRITVRWGLTLSLDPTAIEHDLMNKLPKEHWIRYNTQVILHGREICTARSPKCMECMFLKYCPYGLGRLREQLPEGVQLAIEKNNMY